MGKSLLALIANGQDPTNFNLQTIKHTLDLVQGGLVSMAAFEGFLGIILAGYQYFTAFGDETKAASAKKTIYWAIIGMIIIILSQVLVYEVKRFVVGAEPPAANLDSFNP